MVALVVAVERVVLLRVLILCFKRNDGDADAEVEGLAAVDEEGEDCNDEGVVIVVVAVDMDEDV